jgi:ribonuclease BN (tRNA processing enzyme)
MKIQLLPSTFDGQGGVSPEQRLTSYLIDDRVAVDAGSLALGLTREQRGAVRDVVITHAHMDHVATLPIFIDDLFSTLTEPVRVYGAEEIINLLERDVFNWSIYPRFFELHNGRTRVLEYVPVRAGEEFAVAHLRMTAVYVNHTVPTVGLIVTDGAATVVFTSDTAPTEELWALANRGPKVDAILIEASLPDEMAGLAQVTGHLTPATLAEEARKLRHKDFDVLAVHIQPGHRAEGVQQLAALAHPRVAAMEPGREYRW